MEGVKLVLIVSCTVIITHTNAQRDSCYTPYRKLGVCKPFQQCRSLLRLFEADTSHSTINFLVQSQQSCGNRNYNGDPLLCCTDGVGRRIPPAVEPPTVAPPTVAPPTLAPPPTVAPPTFAPIEETTRGNPRFSFPDEQEGREISVGCFGPDNVPGECISLRQCPSLLSRYASARGDRKLIEFIQASNRICKNADTAVCCPNESGFSTVPPPKEVTRGSVDGQSFAPRLLTPSEGCGASNASHNKVVGGVPAVLGAWPWIVLLGYEDGLGDISFKCGGSLITKRHVLTAAHCNRNDLKTVRLGEYDINDETETSHQDIPISRIVVHPQYDKRDGHSDIAMILLSQDAIFSDKVHPVCIATEEPLLSKDYTDYFPFVAGWGRTEEGGKPSNILQEVQLPVLANSVCKEKYTALRRLLSTKQFDDKIICVGFLGGGKDSCQGDSGSALMIPNNFNGESIFYQIGIVSYGVGCARVDTPGVYTSVQRFTGWIQDMIQQLA